jgi:hypothetical protein
MVHSMYYQQGAKQMHSSYPIQKQNFELQNSVRDIMGCRFDQPHYR